MSRVSTRHLIEEAPAFKRGVIPNSEFQIPNSVHFHGYGYHYQRPQDQIFFRYDYHPEVGAPETHPLYHLHAAGWKKEADNLPQVPRFPVYPTTLEEVLELIRINFFVETEIQE